MDNNVDYKNKYLTYKLKYLELKDQLAGKSKKSISDIERDRRIQAEKKKK